MINALIIIIVIIFFIFIMFFEYYKSGENFEQNSGTAPFIDFKSTHLIGVNISRSYEPTFSACKQTCQDNPKCNIVSWSHLDNTCWQKDYVSHPEWRVGIKDGLKFMCVDKANLPGYPLPNEGSELISPLYGKKDVSESNCSYKCLQDPWCNWFIFAPNVNACWLYTAIKNPYYHTAFKK
jgi:hypothetical protein